MTIDDIMGRAPVIPVLVLDDDAPDPVALAETLVENGLPVIEVTLRTEGALEAMEKMSRVEGAILGAGTVLNPVMLYEAVDYGAQFIVSPGLTDWVVRAAHDKQVPILPGVATASEVMRGLDMGLDRFKFFPAEANGGLPALKAISAPLSMAKFCPTGGIREETAADWLAHDAVLCVGGSWILPKGETDLDKVARRARAAADLAR
ncbi:bifunctional 4-hydroxy-2-oxoglutarate aldolase/2-dehydro-3-deoxy-phosphogluconate aldolase [Sphingomicrobium astaxanthinifaciens]|uniref:bifunctional 4-hydroxy-2-oxoglutarate aldolase/2-dehydro-3-deoxy-phosphogluconate aldolase n=1 Tax=Sphingomicrobium astaxanthinifaciens TaxID=1227949 RepID=UPI001FCCA2E4|nr:bifunctional 4-hydroxy-2-oxoglutarate aldolase/2-dehydro-3-deoxy-phosphogluconate aldolase [Sphingomicrobium astaxanthinifaciens]MCJ7420776.1 bifunctional 4-hydroxy-2-oxoglutarate aldolase/2-dehydro-3-deoxy-phosphogluconate aldolase [Sphingomicrobium astaxanthinifaciens]